MISCPIIRYCLRMKWQRVAASAWSVLLDWKPHDLIRVCHIGRLRIILMPVNPTEATDNRFLPNGYAGVYWIATLRTGFIARWVCDRCRCGEGWVLACDYWCCSARHCKRSWSRRPCYESAAPSTARRGRQLNLDQPNMVANNRSSSSMRPASSSPSFERSSARLSKFKA